MDWKKTIRNMMFWFLGAVLSLIVISMLFFLFIQTTSGKRFLASAIEALFSAKVGGSIRIERIEGFVPFDISIKQLSLQDSEGTWLFIDEASLAWDPSAFAQGRIVIDVFEASSLHMLRFPVERKAVRQDKPAHVLSLPVRFPPLAIRHFSIAACRFESAVMGQETTFSINGRIQQPHHDTRVEGLLEVLRIDGGRGSLTIGYSVDQTTQPHAFSVNAHLEEENGLLAAMLNRQGAGPASLTAHACGLSTDWQGMLEAHLPEVGEVFITMGTTSEFEQSLRADGVVSIDPAVLPASLAKMLAGPIPINLALSYDHQKSIKIHRASARLPSGVLQGSAILDLHDRNLQGKLTLTAEDLTVLEALTGTPCTGVGSIEASFSGTLAQPQATVHAILQPAAIATVHVERFEGTADLVFGESFKDISLNASGSCTIFSFTSAPSVPSTSFDWVLAAHSGLEGHTTIQSFALSGDDLSCSFTGAMDISALTLAGKAEINLPKTSRLSDLWGGAITGATRLQARLEGTPAMFDARIQAFLVEPDITDSSVASLMGNRVDLSAHVSLTDKKEIAVTALNLSSKHANLSGDMAVSFETMSMQGNCLLAIPDLSVLASSLGQPISGSATCTAALRGTLTNPDVTLSVIGAEVRAADNLFPHCSASVIIVDSIHQPRGSLKMDVTFKDSAFTGTADYSLKNRHLAFSDIAVALKENEITGTLSFDLTDKHVQGILDGSLPDISGIASLFGISAAGSAFTTLHLKLGQKGQDVRISLRGNSLTASVGDARELHAQATIRDIFDNPEGEGELVINGFRWNSLAADSLHLSAKSSETLWHVETSLNGTLQKPVAFAARGTLSRGEARNRVRIDFLEAQYGNDRIVLEPPGDIAWSRQEYTVEKLQIRAGSAGMLTVAGTCRTDYITATVQFHDLPLAMVPFGPLEKFDRNVSGALTIAGRPDSPEIVCNFEAQDLIVMPATASEATPVSLNAQAQIKDDRGDCSFSVIGMTDVPILGTISLPVRISFIPFTFMILEQLPLEGKLAGAINLESLQPLVPGEDHAFSGLMKTDITLEGTSNDPNLTGTISVADGAYENTGSGTILKDVTLVITLQDNTLTLTEGKALDNRGGTVSADGWIKIAPEQNFPLNILLTLEKSVLVQRDEISTTASGRLEYTGTLGDATLAGKLTLGATEVRIPDRLPPAVTELTVIEINRPPDDSRQPHAVRRKSTIPGIGLDITVSSPGQLFVRGRGLDSEWKGSVDIVGTAAKPSITGSVSVMRGTYLLFDKRLTLTGGTIIFNGYIPPAPTLYLQAEKRQADVISRIRLAGALSAPEIVLESEPPYPPDEILSRLLFGRSAAHITPFQAIQLTQALELLSGTNMGALDFMDHTRKLLRVDRLTLEEAEDENGGTAVSVGKYLREGIYVEIDKGMSEETDRISIEIGLTPNISIESTTGTNDEGGIGINWKMDY